MPSHANIHGTFKPSAWTPFENQHQKHPFLSREGGPDGRARELWHFPAAGR